VCYISVKLPLKTLIGRVAQWQGARLRLPRYLEIASSTLVAINFLLRRPFSCIAPYIRGISESIIFLRLATNVNINASLRLVYVVQNVPRDYQPGKLGSRSALRHMECYSVGVAQYQAYHAADPTFYLILNHPNSVNSSQSSAESRKGTMSESQGGHSAHTEQQPLNASQEGQTAYDYRSSAHLSSLLLCPISESAHIASLKAIQQYNR
jgi:hypothetical protein